MQRNYTLEWLDLTVNTTLNPQKSDLSALTGTAVEEIIKAAEKEQDKLQLHLKEQVFGITSQAEIELLVRQHHSVLIILLDRAHANHHLISANHSDLKEVSNLIVNCLDNLLGFIETHFSQFLGLDERVPVTYLLVIRAEIKQRLDELKVKFFKRITDKTLSDLVFETLYDFTDGSGGRPVSFRELLYKKQLIKGLEEIAVLKPEHNISKALNALLVYQNFNKKGYLEYFTKQIAEKINQRGSLTEKLEELLLCYKEFNQMYRKSGVKLNPHYTDVKEVIGNWFMEEINFLEKKYQFQVNPLEQNQEPGKAEKVGRKVRLELNADQIGLLLRAAVDVGMLYIKSVHFVFKTVVPFLASANENNLSWDSLRKRSYQVENKDKVVVISILERAITYVQTY